jgi:predicted acylesterase/phospholipase RssA
MATEADAPEHAGAEELSDVADFDQVRDSEHAAIERRRKEHRRELEKLGHRLGAVQPILPEDAKGGAPPRRRRRVVKLSSADEDQAGAVYDTVGVALSGGGIRSAAFCLGALQALDVAKVFKRVDYLSTVSGGGNIGSSLTAALNANGGKFPFASRLAGEETPSLQHIRDYSNFLIPEGALDVVKGAAIYLRGLAANALLVLPWIIFFAALTIWWKPSRATLQDHRLFCFALPDFTNSGFFNVSALALIVLGAALIGWALWRSVKLVLDEADIPNTFTTAFAWFIVAVCVIVVVDLQPFILNSYFDYAQHEPGRDVPVTGYLAHTVNAIIVFLAPVTAAVAFLNSKLGFLIKQATERADVTTRLLGLASKAAIYVSACLVPLVMWAVYLQLTYWGIENGGEYAAPEFIATAASAYPQSGWIPQMAQLYLLTWLVLGLASAFLQPNSNSLHRLYRDRLSAAFLFEPKERLANPSERIPPLDAVELAALSDSSGPYHLINTALNIQSSKVANRRGRNADFFVFSRNYTGSQTTCYVRTKLLEEKEPLVGLGTAMAVSGAAASANMGSATIKPWTLTLALLNVRLGFWMRNPRFVTGQSRPTEWGNGLFNPYFLYEMFGLLNERRWFVYLTDGGHVENLGIYELLRRRCQLIIAVDAEADPDLNFGSFITLQRYARIDLGIRIELPWYEIREVSLNTNKVIKDNGDARTIVSRQGPHCALGLIHYPGGGTGYLLYVKSSVSGDESDYVIDYKRRYGEFPHETTGDQFFSEEQFEVYRNLGFHALQGAFDNRDRIAIVKTVPPSQSGGAAAVSGTSAAQPGGGSGGSAGGGAVPASGGKPPTAPEPPPYTDEQKALLETVMRTILKLAHEKDHETLGGVAPSWPTTGTGEQAESAARQPEGPSSSPGGKKPGEP